jgi:hypothetical protein
VTPILAVLIVALAGHRVARAIAHDDISEPFRTWVSGKAYRWPDRDPWPDGARDEQDAVLAGWAPPGEAVRRSRVWSWVYGLVSCPHCCGFWISIGLWALWVNVGDLRVWVMGVAVAGAQSVLTAKGTQ